MLQWNKGGGRSETSRERALERREGLREQEGLVRGDPVVADRQVDVAEAMALGGGHVRRGAVDAHDHLGPGGGEDREVVLALGLGAAHQVIGKAKEVVEIRSDNKMLVKQMKGEWKVRRGAYVPYYEKVKPLASKFSRISYVWIRREFNEEADALTRRAYEEYLAKRSSAR